MHLKLFLTLFILLTPSAYQSVCILSGAPVTQSNVINNSYKMENYNAQTVPPNWTMIIRNSSGWIVLKKDSEENANMSAYQDVVHYEVDKDRESEGDAIKMPYKLEWHNQKTPPPDWVLVRREQGNLWTIEKQNKNADVENEKQE